MYNKLKLKISKNDLLKVFSLSAISTFLKIITQFISAKIIAVVVGPAGLALLGILGNTTGIAMVISTGAICVGVTKYISEYGAEKEQQREIIQTAMGLTGLCSLIVSLFLIVFARFLSSYLFSSDQYVSIISLLGFTISLYAFHSLWIAILNGYSSVKKIVAINIITSVLSLVLTIALVYKFQTHGAMLSYVLGQTIICGITYFFVRTENWWQPKNIFSIKKTIVKKLLGFTLMSIVASIMMPITQLAIRFIIKENISINAAGIWEGLNRISTSYLLIFTTSISFYFLPKLSSLKYSYEIKK